MQLTDLSFKILITVIAVAILIIEIYNKVYTARKNFKADQTERNKPIRDLEERLNRYEEYFLKDKVRLEDLENRMKNNEHENRIILKMLLALTRHAIDGNNIEGLKAMRDDVQSYLIDK